MVPIRLLENGVVLDDVVRKKGDVAEVPAALAARLVEAGRAAYTVKVRCKVPNAIIGGRVCFPGDELEVSGEQAVSLSNRGAASIVDRQALAPTLRDRLVAFVERVFPPPPGPYSGEPKAKVKVTHKKGAFAVDRTYPTGATAELPQSVAARLVAARAAEWIGEPPRLAMARPAPIELAPPAPPPPPEPRRK